MKKNILLAGVSAILLFLNACKPKETELLGTRDWIIGSWKLQLQGSDLNNNKKFETAEKNPVADSAKFNFQLLDDGRGFRIGANSSYIDTMEWFLYNNQSTLRFKIFDRGFVNNLYFKFESGTKTLTLLDTTVSPGYFRYFERQN